MRASEPTSPPAASRRALYLPRPTAAGWRSAAREFAIIVTGVLVALAAQAWWSGRQERARETTYLRQLLADTRENEARVAGALHEDSLAGEAVASAYAALYSARPLPSSDSLVLLLTNRTFSASEFQPVTGTYDALLSTGDLRLVRNDSLRGQLVAYASELADERDRLQFFLEQGFGDPGRLMRPLPFLAPAFFGDAAVTVTEAQRAGLRTDPDLAAVLFAVRAANLNRVNHLGGLRRETRALRLALEAELAAR